jgi:hypothetical protein
MSDTAAGRWKFFKRLHYHGIFKVVGVIWLLLSIASTLPVVLPPSWAQYLVLFPMLSRWPWYVWVMGLLVIAVIGTFESAYRADRTVQAELAAKTAQIERISKPEKCPIVLVIGWRLDSVGLALSQKTGELESVPMGAYFQLKGEGETAHEVALEEFEIEPSVIVASRVVSHVDGHQPSQAFMWVWIKNKHLTDSSKWDLLGAFRHASETRDGNMMWKPNYCRTLRLTYRDHSDFWYRTTQEIAYVPARREFEFGPIKHEKLGLKRSA